MSDEPDAALDAEHGFAVRAAHVLVTEVYEAGLSPASVMVATETAVAIVVSLLVSVSEVEDPEAMAKSMVRLLATRVEERTLEAVRRDKEGRADGG